ncbi:hypothetical protein GCM10025868_01420 [Angustibacter aerolatus]|uniref:Carbohydrate kinase FGGY N-terminal domain-containing protein n=1 Tax=Angustibacter aerolatus TaxID=1162965 RepID=A0ABQ6JAT6_9ACTN|nr:hypothetical protein GCM10025868_01420 [Angustibacter aerolatus]
MTAGMAGPSLAWLQQHEPAVVARAAWALQPKDWLRARMTGVVATEPSDASATLLLDVVDVRWSGEVLDALHVDRRLLPEPAALVGRARRRPAGVGRRRPGTAGGRAGGGRGGRHRGSRPRHRPRRPRRGAGSRSAPGCRWWRRSEPPPSRRCRRRP